MKIKKSKKKNKKRVKKKYKVVVPVVCTTNAFFQLLITVEVPQLQFLCMVVSIPSVRRDVGCARRAGSHGCRRGGDSRAPTVALVEKFVERGSSSTR